MKEENLVGCARHMIDFLGNELHYNCLGCEIVQKKFTPPGGIIFEDDSFILAQDPEVPLAGFLIVNSKKHIKSIVEMPLEDQHKLIEIVERAVRFLKELKITKEVTLVQEERSSHFHMWIFPCQNWMVEKFGKGISYLRDICSYICDNATEQDKQNVLEVIEKVKSKFYN